MVCRPCSAYQVARAGSMTRTSTLSTWKRRWAIWAIVRFVLSPSVEAMNRSAWSIPASTSASTSMPCPTVNRPPASSHEDGCPASRRSCESGSSSRTETSCPEARAERATAEPTRPAPTMRTNMVRHVTRFARRCPPLRRPRAGLVRGRRLGRRGGQDDRDGGLGQHVLRRLPDEVVARPAAPAEQRPARIRVGSSAPRMITSTPRRWASSTIARPALRARTVAVATSTPWYSSPTALARRSAARARSSCASGSRGVDRQRHRDLEDPQGLDRRPLVRVEVLVLLAGQPPRGLHDVVVERAAQDRDQDRPVLALPPVLLAQQRALGHGDAAGQALALGGAVDDVEQHARGHPPDARVARPLVGDDHADPRRQAEDAAEDRGQRQRRAAEADDSGIRYGRRRSGSR